MSVRFVVSLDWFDTSLTLMFYICTYHRCDLGVGVRCSMLTVDVCDRVLERGGLSLCGSVYMVLLLASASGNFSFAQMVEHECIVPEVSGSRPAWGKTCPGYIWHSLRDRLLFGSEV